MAQDRPDLKPLIGRKLTVIAWLWARTVKSPNPAFAQVDVPLVSTFMLSAKPGKEAYVEPVIEGSNYRFTVKVGKPIDEVGAKNGTSAGKRHAFSCLLSGTPIDYPFIRREATAGRMGARLMAAVAEGERGRVYLPPTASMEAAAHESTPQWRPDCEMPKKHRNFQPPVYGMGNLADIFSSRQLTALTTFSDLVLEAREQIKHDIMNAVIADDRQSHDPVQSSSASYSAALATYLAFAVNKAAEGSTTLCTWSSLPTKLHVVSTFGRQALPMTWDYAETNVFADSSGNILRMTELVAEVIDRQCSILVQSGMSGQADATRLELSSPSVISTDPPYYDNIAYADLSDFFYVWLRRSLRLVYPDLFATLVVPKTEELVASANRHGGREAAEAFFLRGMRQAMHRLAEQVHPSFPVTIYYAFKQSETETEGTASTGWQTFLDAVIDAGFSISGTWPMRTERAGGFRNNEQNALASSIIIVCRPRPVNAPNATRRELLTALQAELPIALAHLQHGNIAPVDLAQAAIGPGMAVYTRYARVLDVEGKQLSVRQALALINQTLDEVLAEQEGDFDADTRWALAWFEQFGFAEAEYGVAETLSKAKDTSVFGMAQAGILVSRTGKVRLFKPAELAADWNPTTDTRLTVWEVVHQLIRALEVGGEATAAALVANLGSQAETARELTYRLYTICERKKRAPEALSYNALVQSWPEITRLAREAGAPRPEQGGLFAEV
jgi:putative DNA methylase